MNKNKIIMLLIIIVLIVGGLFLFFSQRTKKHNNNFNSNSDTNINSNSNDSNSNIENNSNSQSNNNSNIESNSNSQSNSNSNIESNSNSQSNSNSNKSNNNNSNNNSNKNDKSLETNESFSGIFQSDTYTVHMLQINNKVHFYIYNRKTKSTVTIYGNVSKNVVTTNRYNIKFTLKDTGIDFTSTSDSLGNGYIPKIEQYTKRDYFEEFMHGNINGIKGIYTNKYGTIKIYQVYDSQLRISGTVLKKNANTDNERKQYISGATLLKWNSLENSWNSEQYGEDCNAKSPCEWIKIKLNNNSMSVESDSSTINSFFFHAGKYFDEGKNKAEPNINVYTKSSDYSINQIVNDAF